MNTYVELIVQYHGDLQKLLKACNMLVDIINEKYAIITTHISQIPYLQSQIQIEYIEEAERIYEIPALIDSIETVSYIKEKFCLNGDGVVVGWIGNRINTNYNHYNLCDGTSRILCMWDGTREYNRNQISYIGNIQSKQKNINNSSAMDCAIGNTGIASNSEIILVNLEKEEVYTTDIIRAIRFIINKLPDPRTPTVIYFPFDMGQYIGRYKALAQKIISDITLYGKIIIVSSLEWERQDLDRSFNRGHIFSTCAPLTVGVLSLLMEWGIIRRNNPALYGERLRTYYIKKMIPLLKRESPYTRSCRVYSLDDILKRFIPVYTREEFRTLDIAYEFASDDAVIDVMMICSNPNIHNELPKSNDITIYPLVFPYFGIRGVVREIKRLCNEMIGRTATGYLANILGNEPLNITLTGSTPISISKQLGEFKGNNTLIGIIDTGIDYTNPAFIDSRGETRIASIWDQTIGSQSPYGYGTVYDKQMINTALKSPDPLAVVPHKDEWGVGTMLAGIAAGSGKYTAEEYEGVATGAEIAVVKLKPAHNDMQQIYYSKYNPLGFSTVDIALAVQYLVNLAIELKKPISICLALGTNSGSHDGTTILDGILRSYGQNQGVAVVLSGGDEANKNHHASGHLKEQIEQKINLTIPQGQGGFIIEAWARFGDRFEVSLTPPKIGETVPSPILLNKAQTYKFNNDSSVWSQGTTIDKDTGCMVIRFRLNNPLVGNWTITVKGIVVIDGRYNIWIPKTGMIMPETVLSPSNPFTTIYNSAAAVGVITVGCYDEKATAPYLSSGRGPARDDRVKPDFIVKGVNIYGPLPENKFGKITGTAPSSAITVGICSLLYEEQILQQMQLANTPVMKALLTQNLKRQPTVSYPNPSSGYGLLDVNSIFV